jgi:hypothetical protein
MADKESRIRDQRTIEAASENLIGLDGKLGVILRNIGTPILDDSYGFVNSTELDDFYEENNELPECDLDNEEIEVGLLFDGLSKGFNIEIRYINDEKLLEVKHNCILVYMEREGVLECYNPNSSWKTIIDKLYRLARKKEQINNKNKELIEKKETLKAKTFYAIEIFRNWGVNLFDAIKNKK